MPATRTNQQCRNLFVERILLSLRAGILDGTIDRITDVDLTLDRALPGWGECVFEVSHKDFSTRIQRVNDHFSFDGAGNLYAPILQVCRYRSNCPFTSTNMLGFR